MNRLKPFAKPFIIVFAITFSITLAVGALRRSETKPWTEVIGVSAALAATLGIFIAWKLDEYRRAKVQAAVFKRFMQGQSPAVFVDAKGNLIPDDKAPAALHLMRESYEEFLRDKTADDDQKDKP